MITPTIKVDLKPLKKLKANLQKSILKRAVRAGAKLVVGDLRATAPVQTKALRKSIAAKVDSPKGSTLAYAIVGPRSAFKVAFRGRRRRPSRYAHILQRKTQFLTRAMDRKKSQYLAKVQEVISAEIVKTLSR